MKTLIFLFPVVTTRYPNYRSMNSPFILDHLYMKMEAVQGFME